MPNWCDNRLTVRGPLETIHLFKAVACGKASLDGKDPVEELAARLEKERFTWLDFNQFIPYPKRFAEQDERVRKAWAAGDNKERDGYNTGGYDWCISNWGTKWNACHDDEPIPMKTGLKYTFDTAWSPPEPVILKMSEMFPTLLFNLNYAEGGNGFSGTLIVKGGKVITHETRNYSGDRGG